MTADGLSALWWQLLKIILYNTCKKYHCVSEHLLSGLFTVPSAEYYKP